MRKPSGRIGYLYFDVNNFSNAVKKHEQSEKHLEASLKFCTFGKTRIETSLNSQLKLDIERHNAKVDRNQNVFQRLIDIVCYLGKQELAFRGHDESANSANKGNFLEMVDLLSKYDGVLENHLETATNVFSGLSNRTQNDLIHSIASVISDNIKSQINKSDFVAVMIDESPDVSGREQLVLVLRYFHDDEVVDRFIKYIDVSTDRTAATLSSLVLEVLGEYNCLSKLIAQTYDGAAVLSSDLNGVQALIKHQCPLALFVWCSAHVLNLVLSKSCERIGETKRFFNVTKSLANFFHTSTKRMAHYNNFSDMKKIPRAAETRWTYHSRIVNVIFKEIDNLRELFEDMTDDTDKWDGDTLTQATSFLHTLREFEFNFFLHVFNDIFAETDILYNIMQKKTSDIAYCVQKVKEFEAYLDRFRLSFDNIYDKVVSICGQPKRKRNVDDVKLHYKRIFIEIIDNIYNESRDRYSNLKNLKFFELLSCENFNKFTNVFPDELVNEFVNIYNAHNFNIDRLRNELKCIYKSPEFSKFGVYTVIAHFYENNLQKIFPEVLRLAKLIVTIPATSASTERSFSSLKRIHTYLRNTQSQQRLTDLSMLSIEKQLVAAMKRTPTFYNDVLTAYLKKDRRVDLIYK